MKARNKWERNLVEVDKTLPKLRAKHRNWAYKYCLPHAGVRLKSGLTTCLDCGTSWFEDTDSCPKCRRKLSVETTRVKNYEEESYMTMLNVHNGYQLIRQFHIHAYYKAGKKAKRYFTEVSRIYIDEKGKYAIFGFSYMNSFYGDRWFGSFGLKHPNTIDNHSFRTDFEYPEKETLDSLEKLGYLENTEDIQTLPYFKIFHVILSVPQAETFWKAGENKLFKACFDKRLMPKIKKYWKQIKISLRNGYEIKSLSNWFDYLYLLEQFGKDINSPKYICPVDFNKEHDRYVQKLRAMQKKKDLEYRLKKMQKEEEEYNNLRKKFFELMFQEKTLTVKVIESVSRHKELGDYFGHCIYTNEYYKEKESLMLYASIKDRPVEAVEFSLSEWKVTQARGLGNKSSRYHKRIINLVNENSRIIKRLAVSRKKSA